MRILILDTSPIRRGAQVFGFELAEHLRTLGHEIARVYLFLPKEKETLPIGEGDVGFSFFEDSLFEKIPSFQFGLISMLKRKVDDFQPEFILCNGSKTLKYGAWLKFFHGLSETKLVGRFIDDAEFWNPGGVKKSAYSFWINQFDAFVAVSQNSMDSFNKYYRFKKPSRVIHRVFDPKKFANAPGREEARKRLALKDQEEVLLFLGNLTSQKRPDRFVEIVTKLSKTRPNLKALIVGDGAMRKELEYHASTLLSTRVSSKQNQEARDKKQEDRSKQLEKFKPASEHSSVFDLHSSIFFTGYHQDVSPYLAAADLLILTSDTEGLPGVVLEAAHFGVPTVATEVGGIKECLSDGETGFLIPDRSIDHFCEKINFLLINPETKLRMGQNAQTFISQNFKMNQVAKQYLDFFSSLIHPNYYK
jgi:glycosyltransferase involved in cell wall biosynthesis